MQRSSLSKTNKITQVVALIVCFAAASAAARALGHLVGIIHVKSHAIIFVSYAITAFVYASKNRMIEEVIEEKSKWLTDRLLYWEINTDKISTTWAPFLSKDEE